jgi:hypothetical protein
MMMSGEFESGPTKLRETVRVSFIYTHREYREQADLEQCGGKRRKPA